jgi:hypothetical protein
MPTLPIDEAALREAMRDRRYWQPGHPERERYGAGVTEGWQALDAAPDQGADTVVHVRAYERRGPDGDVIQVQAHTRGASPRPWENQPNPEWRAQIASIESRATSTEFGYHARNARSGALGRYQMVPVALQAIRWKDSQGSWTGTANQAGIRTDADFLANPGAQESAFTQYLANNEREMEGYGLFRFVGQTVRGAVNPALPITESGLAAAAHRAGARAVADYFARRAANASPQGLDLAVETRLRVFGATSYRRIGGR